MIIKPKKKYKNIYEAMQDCVERMKHGEKNLVQDGDTIVFDAEEYVEFEVTVEDADDKESIEKNENKTIS